MEWGRRYRKKPSGLVSEKFGKQLNVRTCEDNKTTTNHLGIRDFYSNQYVFALSEKPAVSRPGRLPVPRYIRLITIGVNRKRERCTSKTFFFFFFYCQIRDILDGIEFYRWLFQGFWSRFNLYNELNVWSNTAYLPLSQRSSKSAKKNQKIIQFWP